MGDSSLRNKYGLTFGLADGNRKLKAFYDPVSEKPPLSTIEIRQALTTGDFADLFIYDHAFDELIKRYNTASQEFSFDLGERRDGTCLIRTTTDNLEARLTISRPWGGTKVTVQLVMQTIKERGIVTGVLVAKIEEAVSAGEVTELLIARGIPPEPGVDGELVSFVPEIRNRESRFDENEVVDFRDLGEIISVTAGTPLMRRIPPVPGKPGENILGKEIPPPPVKNVEFAPNLSGTAYAPDDPNLLLAAIDGQPVLVTGGVTVEPVIKLKNIDLSTGNLTFKGTIDVAGDVTAGMTVKATGDIIIGGVVEAATVEADGNIEVRGGIIGQGETKTEAEGHDHETARIRAKGTVSALFVESAFVEAGDTIEVHGFAMQSDLLAGNRIIVGDGGSGKGSIIGGSCQAVTLVQAATLGSRAGVHTLVSVGADPHVKGKLSTVKLKLQEKERELEEIGKKLDYLMSVTASQRQLMEIGSKLDCASSAIPNEDQLNRTREAKEKLVTAISELAGEKKRLQKRLERVAEAQITAGKAVLSGVIISIGNQSLQIVDDLTGSTTFKIEDNSIVAAQ
ncbi:MAG: DUF342 domain-containing protein [Desulfuromonadales bacterium]|nr:MAG: DUF342 domain-containing protein [Desulfuromonadales bacterium]